MKYIYINALTPKNPYTVTLMQEADLYRYKDAFKATQHNKSANVKLFLDSYWHKQQNKKETFSELEYWELVR